MTLHGLFSLLILSVRLFSFRWLLFFPIHCHWTLTDVNPVLVMRGSGPHPPFQGIYHHEVPKNHRFPGLSSHD